MAERERGSDVYTEDGIPYVMICNCLVSSSSGSATGCAVIAVSSTSIGCEVRTRWWSRGLDAFCEWSGEENRCLVGWLVE